MKISRFLVLALLLGALASSSAYALPTVTITWATGHSATAGEFILTTSDNGTFNSFCLEKDEYITIGGTYWYTTSDQALRGGVNTDSGDAISIGTAWLYSNFRAGTLAGYAHTYLDQTSLQEAFWYLEEEITSAPSNPWIAAAQLALPGVNLRDNANGAYGVYVMNLWGDSGGTDPKQSQLAVPDGGLTVTLLGLGLGGLAVLRRKLR